MQKLNGFLLTRQWRDTATGIELIFWVQTDKGAVRVVIDKQEAVCFIRQSNQMRFALEVQRRPLKLNTFQYEPVDGLYFKQQRDLNQLREHLAYDKKLLLESDIKPTDRYLMERFITSTLQIKGKAIQKGTWLEFHNPTLSKASYTPKLSWLSLDIETHDLRGKLYSIAASTATDSQVFIAKSAPNNQKIDVKITWCRSEREVLQGFFHWFKQQDPDLIIGWNVIGFDLDFLQWKCRQLRISLDLGRGNDNATVLAANADGKATFARISGRAVLDGISSLRSAFWKFESFALDAVAEELLGRRKLIDHKEDKLTEIRRLYREDPIALAAYNLEDCQLVADIFEKTDLINFSIQRANMTGLAIDRQGGSVAAFDNLYLPQLHRRGFVAPDLGSLDNPKSSPGGYVMRSVPGLYKNVLVLDFKSLYPSIIRTFKIDPMGLTIKDQQRIDGFLGATFSREQHILPTIVTQLWQQRDMAKKEQNAPLSQAVKIIMNSFYGVLGSSGCRFFNPQLASSITMRGHEILQRSRDVIEAEGYQVLYGDTDSVFVLLGENFTEKQALSTGHHLANRLNKWWQKTLQTEHQLDSQLEIEFETHYIDFLLPTTRGSDKGSKKRYAGTVSEQGKTKMVFKGLETVRSDWTQLAKDFQQELYARIFNQAAYKNYINDICQRIWQGEYDDKLVYTKRLRRPLASYTRTQPPHVKAAKKMQKPSRRIQYVITRQGPEPVENIQSPIDYQHYIDKQLQPVADSILYFLDTSFEKVTQRQLDVFG